MCIETVFASVMFILIGCRVLSVPEWVANVFFVAVFGQISAGAVSITKYLFPPGKTDGIITHLLRLRRGLTRKGRGRKNARASR